MVPKSNVHSHTTFADGRNTPEEMVLAALKLGFHTLGFSEHAWLDIDPCCMRPEQEPLYRTEIRRLQQRYGDRIHILLGCEHDWFSPAGFSEYEYAIESVHFVRAGGESFCVDRGRAYLEDVIRRCYGGDPYALCRDYFRTVCESCLGTRADILGHIELVMKFNEKRDLFDDADPRYLRAALEAADCAADSGRLVEINTGAIARGYRSGPYPGPAMLRRLAERNAPILLTSDCHNAAFLDYAFGEALALARACGFRSAWMYRGPKPEEYPLEGN